MAIHVLPEAFSTRLIAPLKKGDSIIPIPVNDELYLMSFLPNDGDYAYIRISKPGGIVEPVRVINVAGRIGYARLNDFTFRYDFPTGSCVDAKPTGAAIKDWICNIDCCEGECGDEDPCNPNKVTGLVPNIGEDLADCDKAMNAVCDIPMKDGCQLGYYPNKCGYMPKAVHINAIVSELLNIIKLLGGEYDCSRLDNIASLLQDIINKIYQAIKDGDNSVLDKVKEMLQQLIDRIQNGDIDISNALKCIHLDSADTSDTVLPVGLVRNKDKDCLSLKVIPFPQTVTNRVLKTEPGVYKITSTIPEEITMVTLRLQGAGGAGGVYSVNEPAEPGGDTFVRINGIEVARATGGQSGVGGQDDVFPRTAHGGIGRVVDDNFVYDVYIANVPSGSGKRDWLESTLKKAGGLGDGGKSIGPLGRNGLQTGCFQPVGNGELDEQGRPKQTICDLTDEDVKFNWQTLCGFLGGGAGGGNVNGCQWGSGGGAGGYIDFTLQLVGKDGTRATDIEITVGAGAHSRSDGELRGKGGDGYFEIVWG